MSVNNWDWSSFFGSAEGLKWNRKEIPVLEEIMSMVADKGVVVQAGANLGIFPKRLAMDFKTVYTFEPEPMLFQVVCRNARETNIIKFQAALGCDRQLIGMSRKRRQNDGGVSHEGISHVSGDGVIPTLQIDDLGLKKCDLIYLDIEGYELYAIRGAINTLRECRPLVALEVNKSLEQMGGITRDDIHSFMRLMEYDFVKKIRSDEVFKPREKIR